MFIRLIAAAFCLGATFASAAAGPPDLAAIARIGHARHTFHQVLKGNSIGARFAGNFPDVARPASAEQIAAWRILVRVLQARYGIPNERVYAHNWIDYKDARYCEGCALATLARQWGE